MREPLTWEEYFSESDASVAAETHHSREGESQDERREHPLYGEQQHPKKGETRD